MDTRDRLHQAMRDLPERWSGRLCLDFANTVEPRGGPSPFALPVGFSGPPPTDYLMSYPDLVAWGTDTRVLAEEGAVRLLEAADRRPAEAQTIFARAIVLREAIYRTFWRVAHGEQTSPDDLATLKREHLKAMDHAALTATTDGYGWSWEGDEDALDRVVWSVARSATDLLTAAEPDRIKVCPGVPGDPIPCAWLFYDASKNGARLWCSMDDCGKISKAQRQTDRRRSRRTRSVGTGET